MQISMPVCARDVEMLDSICFCRKFLFDFSKQICKHKLKLGSYCQFASALLGKTESFKKTYFMYRVHLCYVYSTSTVHCTIETVNLFQNLHKIKKQSQEICWVFSWIEPTWAPTVSIRLKRFCWKILSQRIFKFKNFNSILYRTAGFQNLLISYKLNI